MGMGHTPIRVYLTILSAWLLTTTLTPAHAGSSRTLGTGDTLQLTETGTHTLTFKVKQQGYYRIQTTGESDTHCTLYGWRQGPIASDDDSGPARNCSIEAALDPGPYRIVIKRPKTKGNPASKVALTRYQEQGRPEIISLGHSIRGSLQANAFRQFAFRVKRRQWLTIGLKGATVGRCTLRKHNGWLLRSRSARTFRVYNSRKRRYQWNRSCSLHGFVEPGAYVVSAFGTKARMSQQTLAPMQLKVGNQPLRFLKWKHFGLNRANTFHTFWLEVPTYTKTPHKLVSLAIDITRTSGSRYTSWRAHLTEQDWTDASGRRVGNCWGNRYTSTCSLFRKVTPGKRYLLRVYANTSRPMRFKVRAIQFLSQTSVKANRRIRAIALRNSRQAFTLTVPKAGEYWVEASPRVKSCILEANNQPKHKRIIAHQGPILRPHSTTTVMLYNRHSGGDHMFWIRVPKQGLLKLETTGKLNTYGRLKTWDGSVLQYDSSSGKGRNFRINQNLKPGVYQVYIRIYGRRQNVPLHMTYTPNDPKYKTIPAPRSGCRFSQVLQAGTYTLHLPDAKATAVRSIGLFGLPLSEGNILKGNDPASEQRVPVMLGKQYALSVQGVATCALLQGNTKINDGKRRGNTCFLTGTARPGMYHVQIKTNAMRANEWTLRHGSRATLAWSQPLSKRPNSIQKAAPIRTISDKKALWVRFRQHETRWFRWHIKQAGVYHLETLGHVGTHCTIQSASYVLNRATNGNSCSVRQFLRPGQYLVQVSATSTSHGNVGLKVTAAHTRTFLGQLKPARSLFAGIPRQKVGVFTFFSQDKQIMQLKTNSLDQSITCLLMDRTAWIIEQSSTCAFSVKPSYPKGQIYVWAIPADANKYTRLHAMLGTTEQWKTAFPNTPQTLGSRDPNKTIPLQLNLPVQGYVSTLGVDTYGWKVTVPMRVDIQLTQGMEARVLRGQTLLTSFQAKASNTTTNIALQPGTHQLLVRHTSGQAGKWYNLSVRTTQVTPGIRLWVQPKQSLTIAIDKPQRVVIQTAGLHDVWCDLQNVSGKQIASNDNRSANHWDCRLSIWLTPGKYALGMHSATHRQGKWVTIKQIPVQPWNAKRSKPWKRLRAGRVIVASTKVRVPTLLAFYAQTKGGRVGCLVASNRKPHRIAETNGSSCKMIRLVGPGRIQWRIRSLQPGSFRYRMGLTKPSGIPTLRPARKTLTLTAKKSHHVLLRVRRSGTYQFDGLTKTPGIHCRLAMTNQEPRNVSCTQTHYLKRGTWHLVIETNTPTAHIVKLKRAPLQAGQTQSLSVPSARMLYVPLQVNRTTIYRVTVKGNDDQRWGCALGRNRQVTETPNASNRCTFVQKLKKGQRRLLIWRPRQPNQQHESIPATIQFEELQEPAALTPWNTGHTRSGTVPANTSTGFTIAPQGKYIRYRLVLSGTGTIWIRSKRGNALRSCTANGTLTSCQWDLGIRRKTGDLLLAANEQGLQYEIQYHASQPKRTRFALRAGSQTLFPKHRGNGSLIVWLKPPKVRQKTSFKNTYKLAINGGTKECFVFGRGARFQKGCRQDLRFKRRYKRLLILYKRMPSQAILARQGASHHAIWGPLRPTKQPDTNLVPAGQKVALYRLTKKLVVWSDIVIKQPTLLALQGDNVPMVCALFSSQNELLTANAKQTGCQLQWIASPGTYRLGIRHPNGLRVRGNMLFKGLPISKLTQQSKARYLLAAGMQKWFVFQADAHAKASSTIGVGVVGQHDDLRCRIFDAKGTLLGDSCHSYLKRPKGPLYLQVRLPNGTQATPFKVVLRGLAYQPAQPPRAYLNLLLNRQQ